MDGALEVLVATHPHADHIGGLITVLNTFEVKEVWHNGGNSTSKTYSDFISVVNTENAEVYVARLHDKITAGELSFYVHHASRLFDSTNNNSIVLHLAYGEVDFLFTGDAEKEAEGVVFTPDQLKWLDAIKDHIANSLEIQTDDFEYAPFNTMGGLGKVYQLFGDQLPTIIDELNMRLAA